MQHFSTLNKIFEEQFIKTTFPAHPKNLYDACNYFLKLGGKRIRPVCVLMSNELFDNIDPDAFEVANAVELFHNFTLIHDDIMDKAPLRRGRETVHIKYNEATALLAGDVMIVKAYDCINKIKTARLKKILALFNKTAREVCEGQQLDMDFEKMEEVNFDNYLHMITLKTSVLLAASLQMGAVLGGAGLGNQQHIFEFGKKLGIAFQVQDDYLDALGDPEKFGKKLGGDILANKKTFLLIHAMEALSPAGQIELKKLLKHNDASKVEKVIALYHECKAGEWATALKEKYFNEALEHLEDIAVTSSRKKDLEALALFLMQRES
ncbi:MAG: polyprenyl synthetase family protein [Ferruginibacter sp.]